MLKRTLLLLSLAISLMGIVSSVSAQPVNAAGEKMNVLFIISDDLRTDLGCYGHPFIKTPNIDALAAQGVRFERAYCQFPLCNPSRASMLNARQPTSTHVLGNRDNFRELHPDFVSLPQLFKQHGYLSLRSGKVFHGGIDDPLAWTEGGDGARGGAGGGRAGRGAEAGNDAPARRGAADQAPPAEDEEGAAGAAPAGGAARRGRAGRGAAGGGRQSDAIYVLEGMGETNGDYRVADRGIEFLTRHKDQPFLLFVGFAKPHSPPEAPQSFFDMYKVEDMPLTADFQPRPTVPEGFPRRSIRPRNADLFIGRDASEQEAREVIRAYYASTSWMDWNVGRVMKQLDDLKLREKTIVVFWGDHGYQLGEKGKWSKAGSVWEQGCHVPLIIVDPRAAGNGKTSPRVVQSIDIYPTLADLCGLPIPEGLDGRSLAPLLKDPQAEWKHHAYTLWSEDGKTLTGVVVRTEKWRYAEFDDGGKMLTDLASDPLEIKNLANDPQYARIVEEHAALAKQYKDRFQPNPQTGARPG